MKTLFTSLFIILFCQNIFAQNTKPFLTLKDLEGKEFVYLYNHQIDVGEYVEYRKPMFNLPFIRVDAEEYQEDEVKFFSSTQGFFANTQGITRSSKWVRRTTQGKINLYDAYTPYVDSLLGKYELYNKKSYYNLDLGDLKKVNYTNLKMDLADHPQALLHLEKYKRQDRRAKIMTTTSFVMIGASLISMSARAYNSPLEEPMPNFSVELGMLFGGTVLSWISHGKHQIKLNHICEAIKTYNED